MKTTINKKMRVITVALLLSGLVPSTMMAQDKVDGTSPDSNNATVITVRACPVYNDGTR